MPGRQARSGRAAGTWRQTPWLEEPSDPWSRASASWLVPAPFLSHPHTAVDGHSDQREKHGEVEPRFVKERQEPVAGEPAERKRAKGVAKQDGDLGGDECRQYDGEQSKRGVAGEQIEGNGEATDDFNGTDEWAQEMRKR